MAGPRSRGEIRAFWRTFSRNQLAVGGGAIVLILVTLAVLAPVLAPWDPNRPDTKKILIPPSGSHWLGTDPLGRDVLSRVLYGSRVSLAVGFVSVGIAAAIGVLLGAAAGYHGGVVDNLVMRLVDIIWLIAPSFEHHGFPIHWMNVAIPAGLAGVWLFLFARQLRSRPLLPLNDPFYKETFAHDAH